MVNMHLKPASLIDMVSMWLTASFHSIHAPFSYKYFRAITIRSLLYKLNMNETKKNQTAGLKTFVSIPLVHYSNK